MIQIAMILDRTRPGRRVLAATAGCRQAASATHRAVREPAASADPWPGSI